MRVVERAAPCARARTSRGRPTCPCCARRSRPARRRTSSRRRARGRASASDGGGTTRSTSAIALSLRMPVGSPSRVADDRAARRRPRRARDAGRSQRRAVGERHVPVEPVDPDRMVRRDRVDPVAARQLAAPELWSQSPPVIQVPAGTVAAKALMRATNSSRRPRVAQLHRREAKPPSTKCTCESMNPGTTRRPLASHGFCAVRETRGSRSVVAHGQRFGHRQPRPPPPRVATDRPSRPWHSRSRA